MKRSIAGSAGIGGLLLLLCIGGHVWKMAHTLRTEGLPVPAHLFLLPVIGLVMGGLIGGALGWYIERRNRGWSLFSRRIPPDQCKHCGYNLAGNVSGICPECGVKV